ncbi:MAG: hypothetical protein QOC95_1479, partial [Thermoleophilaceae bacterium]|nr:hypothetical protein [Thermoleophilaceae bacterium]
MASRDRPRRRFAVLRLAVLTGAVAVTALLDAPADTRAVRAVPVASTGAMSITSSHSGAILSASRLLPGDSVTGSVTITNSGEAPALVTLSQADLVDSPGHAGARLSAALLVEVEDVTSNRRVYFGPLATMPPVDLGRFAAGAARLIRFTATVPVVLPPGLMKTSTSVRYDWTATEADEDAAAPPATKANPEPDPTPPAPEPT